MEQADQGGEPELWVAGLVAGQLFRSVVSTFGKILYEPTRKRFSALCIGP